MRSVEADDHPDVAAVVRGVWSAPEFRRGAFFARDPVSGRPLLQELRPLEFVLALPASAAAGAPAPVVFYQHGNPGTPEEAVDQARRYLGAAGFAVVGFQDVLSRELGGGARDPATAFALQVSAIVSELLRHGRLVDAWAQTNAEQLAFLRAIEGLKDLDLLPLGAPDGVSDLDLAAPRLYEGVSQGANHAPAFLAYAPEIRAAALVAGGSRLTEQLIHQASSFLLTTFGALLPGLTPADLWFGMALFQAVHDRQDAHNHARFLHREPVELDGSTRRASVLLIGGLEDSLVPNHATESLAWALGPLPHLEPGAREVPILRRVAGPVQANLGADATGAFVHYAPPFVPGVPASPGCRSGSADGHFCAQSAAESRRQRLRFFESALDPLAAPTITSPYEE